MITKKSSSVIGMKKPKRVEVKDNQNGTSQHMTDFEIKIARLKETDYSQNALDNIWIPTYILEIMNYCHLFDELEINVQDKEDKKNWIPGFMLERQIFMIFECLPRNYWNYKVTYRQLAADLGITQEAFLRWRKKQWFWFNHTRLMRKIFSLKTPDVINALYEWATTSINEYGKKDSAAIKLWLEYIEKWSPSLDVTSQGKWITVQFASLKSPFISNPEDEWAENK